MPIRYPLDSVGFEITSGDGKTLFYTGDNRAGLSSIGGNISPRFIIADVTWPNSLANAAKDAGHLCPEMLKRLLIDFQRVNEYLPEVMIIHLSPQFESEIYEEIKQVADNLKVPIKVTHEGAGFIL